MGKPTVLWFVVFVGVLGILALIALAMFVAPQSVHAQDRPTETRVDLFDTKGNRTGAAIINERTGRIDRFDTHGRREGGYGIIDQRNGRIDTFDGKGQRQGYGTVAPGSSRGGRR